MIKHPSVDKNLEVNSYIYICVCLSNKYVGELFVSIKKLKE